MPQSGSPPDPFDAGSKLLILQANAALETVGFPVNQTSTNIFRGPISITNSGVFRVGGNSRLELSGPISGENGLLVLTNGGTLALSGTNTYTSNTIVHSGTLLLTSSSNLPANTTLILSNRTTTGNAALSLGNNAVFPVGNPMNVSLHNAAVTIGGDGTWNGPITLIGGNNFGLYGGADGLNLLGTIITNGNAKVSIEGDKTRVAGSLKFTNEMGIGVSSGLGAAFNERFTTVQFDSQNYWTNTVFGRGRIILGASNALPPSAPMRLGVLSAGVGDRRLFLDLNGFNQTVTTVAETAVGDSLIRFGNSSTNGNSMLTVATPTGATNTWAIRLEDDLENQLDYTNNLGLTVTSGLLVLVNTNTYTGPTLVSGGTLLLNLGSGIAAGRVGQLGDTTVIVNGTGTLGGNGIIAGPVTVGAGGTLSAGTSIGRLTIKNTLELQTGSRAVFEVNVGTTNDQVVGVSTLTYGGTLVVTNVGAVPFADGNVFKLFDAANYVAGAVAIQPASPGTGLAWDTSKLAADGTLRVVPLPPAPVIASYGTLADGNFSITVNGVDGRQYSLLASTNVAAPISAWTLIKSDTQTGSSIVLTDLGATNHPTRFYLISTP
jgi:autotransporter-associated beta strand protein